MATPLQAVADSLAMKCSPGRCTAGAAFLQQRTLSTSAALTPQQPWITIYSSPKPKLVLAASKLLTLKSAACLGYGAHVLSRAVDPSSPAFTAAKAPTVGAVHDLISLTSQLGGGFLLMGLLAGYFAAILPRRTVLRVELQRAGDKEEDEGKPLVPKLTPEEVNALSGQNPRDLLRITHPGLLWGTRTVTLPRATFTCTSGTKIIQSFRMKNKGGTRYVSLFLFPVEPHWTSDDLAYLRTLCYGEFFRPNERSPPPDAPLIAIEGFGSYRPAQFADPHHAAFQWFEPGEKRALPSTPFRIEQGTVWADFRLPASRSVLEARRARERAVQVAGKGAQEAMTGQLPTLPASTDLLLDGSRYDPAAVVDPLPVIEGGVGQGQDSRSAPTGRRGKD